MLTLFSISPHVVAKDVPGGSANGSTVCGPSTTYCDADVYNLVLPNLVIVENGDTVIYAFDVEWHDYRLPNSPMAHHQFSISVDYPDRPPVAQVFVVQTYGQQSGHHHMELEVPNVEKDVSVSVYFAASIDVNSGQCVDYDSEGGQQYYG